MTAPTPSVSPELKALMRRLKLGRLLDTLPERLALARSHDLTHAEFLEQLFSDEVQRRDTDVGQLGQMLSANGSPAFPVPVWWPPGTILIGPRCCSPDEHSFRLPRQPPRRACDTLGPLCLHSSRCPIAGVIRVGMAQ